jgi:hypothetical protein
VSKTIAVNGVVNSLTTIASQPTSSISVCQNGSSTLGVSAIGGGLTYQWYTNTTNSTTGGTSLGSSNGAQTATLTLNTTIAGTKYYYVLVTGSCGAAVTSTTSAVTISPTTVSGTISGTTSICSGTTTSLTLAGNVGTVQWQSSTDNSSWANISGETSSSYTTPVLNATTYYRANVISGVCSSSNTSAITITVNSLPSTPTVASTNIDYCQGSTAAALSATATTGHTLIWTYPAISNTGGTAGQSLSNGIYTIGQSFTATSAVTLSGITLKNQLPFNVTAPELTLTLYQGEGLTGTVIGTATYSGAMQVGEFTFQFTNPITLTQGQKYTFNISVATSSVSYTHLTLPTK